MKRFRKLGALLLAGALGLGGLWPSLVADASDFSIDDTGFKNPKIDHMTIYKWVEGIPGYSWSQTFGKKFPVLMTWDGNYYFKITQAVADEMSDHIAGAGDDSVLHGWSDNDDDSGYVNGSFDADGQYPHGYFLQNSGYPGTPLSELNGLNYELLDQKGSFVTLGVPEGLPNLIVTWPGNYATSYSPKNGFNRMYQNVRYALEVDLPNTGAWYSKNYVGKYHSDGGLRQGENYLVGVRRDHCRHWITPGDVWSLGKDYHHMANGFYWSLYAYNETTYKEAVKHDSWFHEIQGDDYKDFSCAVTHEYNTYPFVDWYCWYGAQRTGSDGKKYQCFWTLGSWIHGPEFYLCDELDDYDEVSDLTYRSAKVALGHWDNYFETRGNFEGNDVLDTFTGAKANLSGANQNEFSFRCFYAKPLTIDFLQTDFSVEDGQVTNLDGPIAIANGTTITVKDGGTLSVSGWLMNNGTIKVEEGGTLYVQDNSCVNRYNDGKHYGGGIISNGLIIVGENAKLIGGGVDGIQLKDGAHVVNYGCLASENVTITNDHTVENRDSGFCLFGAGNGVLNSGNLTYETPLSGQDFAERGRVEENVAAPNIAPNAIYQN